MTENLCRKSIKNAVEVKEYQILYHLRELRQQIGNAKMTFGIFDTERYELCAFMAIAEFPLQIRALTANSATSRLNTRLPTLYRKPTPAHPFFARNG